MGWRRAAKAGPSLDSKSATPVVSQPIRLGLDVVDGGEAPPGDNAAKQRDRWLALGRFSQQSFAVGDGVTYEIDALPEHEAASLTFAARAGRTPLDVASTESADRRLSVFFALPQDASTAELLIVRPQQDHPAEHEANADRITRVPVPIHDGRVEADGYIEGGAVALGEPNRLRLETRDASGRRTRVRGRLEDATGRMLSNFETNLWGKATVDITPDSPQVRLSIDHPPNSGGKLSFEFPPSPATLRLDRDILRHDEPLSLLLVGAEDPSRYWIDVSNGDQLVGRQWGGDVGNKDAQVGAAQHPAADSSSEASSNSNELRLDLPDAAQGLMQATLYSLDQQRAEPLASRRFYRFPRQRLDVRIGEYDEVYAPGDTVESLRVYVSDEEGRSVDAATHVLIAHQDDVAIIQERIVSELSGRFFPDLESEQAQQLTHWIVNDEPERLSWWMATRPSGLEAASSWRSNQAETRLVAQGQSAARRARGLELRRWLHGGSATAALILLAALSVLMLRRRAEEPIGRLGCMLWSVSCLQSLGPQPVDRVSPASRGNRPRRWRDRPPTAADGRRIVAVGSRSGGPARELGRAAQRLAFSLERPIAA